MKKIQTRILIALAIVLAFSCFAFFIAGDTSAMHLYFGGLFIGYLFLGNMFLGSETKKEQANKNALMRTSMGVISILFIIFIVLHIYVECDIRPIRWSVLTGAWLLYFLVALNTGLILDEDNAKSTNLPKSKIFLVNSLGFITVMVILARILIQWLFPSQEQSIYYVFAIVITLLLHSIMCRKEDLIFINIDLTLIIGLMVISYVIFILSLGRYNSALDIEWWLPVAGMASLVITSYINYLFANRVVQKNEKNKRRDRDDP